MSRKPQQMYFPEELWRKVKKYQIDWKKTHRRKFKDVTGLIKFHQEIKEFLLSENLLENVEFYLNDFTYRLDQYFKKFFPEDFKRAPYEEIPLNKFYLFDNIGTILLKYLSGEDEHLLKKVLIYYPEVGNKNPELFNYAYKFGKRKKKKSKKKLSSDIKKKCKKKGIRLTYTRNGKRVYKSEKVLRKQLANRS